MSELLRQLKPESPYLWPEARQIMGQAAYTNMPPTATLVEKADTLFGLVLDLKDSGIDWLHQHFLSRPNVRCTLVFVVYAACPTRERQLSRLIGLVPQSDSVAFDLPLPWIRWRIIRSSCCRCWTSSGGVAS